MDGRDTGNQRSPLDGRRILDYFGAHSTTHPNQHQYENTDYMSSSSIRRTRNGQYATAVILLGGSEGWLL